MKYAKAEVIGAALAVVEGAWSDPDWSLVGDGLPEAPPLPVDQFGRWGSWILAFAASKSAPADYAALGFLTVASAAVGASRTVSPWPGWTEYPALWGLMIGPPSASKSPVFGPLVEMLKTIEREEAEGFAGTRRQFETDKRAAHETRTEWEGQVARSIRVGDLPPLKPASADEPEEPGPPRMVVADATVESLAPLFKANPRGLILARDELAAWIGNFGKYGGDGDAAFFLSCFTGEPVTVDRVKVGNVTADRALLAVFGGIQPERMRDLLLKRPDDGFVSRLLFVFPNPVARVRPSATVNMQALAMALRRLRGLAFTIDGDRPTPGILPLTVEAARVFEQWWRANGEAGAEASGFTAGSLGKGPAIVLRLALLLELLDWVADSARPEPEAVGEVWVLASCALFDDYFAPMAARVFGGSNRTPADMLATRIMRQVRRTGERTVNARTLTRGLRPRPRCAEVSDAFDVLQEGGWARFVGGREGERPGVQRGDWEINPLLWERAP